MNEINEDNQPRHPARPSSLRDARNQKSLREYADEEEKEDEEFRAAARPPHMKEDNEIRNPIMFVPMKSDKGRQGA